LAEAVKRGIVEKISRNHVQCCLETGNVRPHGTGNSHRPDLALREKVNVICKLPPQGAQKRAAAQRR
jgi:hypothetical protein